VIKSPPTEILDYLYLGNQQQGANKKMLKDLGITRILNVKVREREREREKEREETDYFASVLANNKYYFLLTGHAPRFQILTESILGILWPSPS